MSISSECKSASLFPHRFRRVVLVATGEGFAANFCGAAAAALEALLLFLGAGLALALAGWLRAARVALGAAGLTGAGAGFFPFFPATGLWAAALTGLAAFAPRVAFFPAGAAVVWLSAIVLAPRLALGEAALGDDLTGLAAWPLGARLPLGDAAGAGAGFAAALPRPPTAAFLVGGSSAGNGLAALFAAGFRAATGLAALFEALFGVAAGLAALLGAATGLVTLFAALLAAAGLASLAGAAALLPRGMGTGLAGLAGLAAFLAAAFLVAFTGLAAFAGLAAFMAAAFLVAFTGLAGFLAAAFLAAFTGLAAFAGLAAFLAAAFLVAFTGLAGLAGLAAFLAAAFLVAFTGLAAFAGLAAFLPADLPPRLGVAGALMAGSGAALPRLLTAAFFAGGWAGEDGLVARFTPRFAAGLAGLMGLAAFWLREPLPLGFGGEGVGVAPLTVALPLSAAATLFPRAGDLGLAGLAAFLPADLPPRLGVAGAATAASGAAANTVLFLPDLVDLGALGDGGATTASGAARSLAAGFADFFTGEVFLALLRPCTTAGLGGDSKTAAFPLVAFLVAAAGLVVATS